MKSVFSLLMVLFSSASAHAEAMVGVRFNFEPNMAPNPSSYLSVRARLEDGEDGLQRTADLGEFPATFGTHSNGSAFARIEIPAAYFLDDAQITSLTVSGFTGGCTIGFASISNPFTVLEDLIGEVLGNDCPDFDMIAPGYAFPSLQTTSGHIGNSNQSRNDALLNLTMWIGCEGTCASSSNVCMIAGISTKVIPVPVAVPPIGLKIIYVPVNDTRVTFVDTNNNGIPDTYNVTSTSMNDRFDVSCKCLSPDAPN